MSKQQQSEPSVFYRRRRIHPTRDTMLRVATRQQDDSAARKPKVKHRRTDPQHE